MPVRTTLPILFVSLSCITALAQEQTPADSIQALNEVVVQGYLSHQPLVQTPASVGLLTKDQLSRNSGQSLLPAVNMIPGVRMEERSPGSYRLSIRGSLLRSPFGVRNVKVYVDEFPLTDASGNTYINLIDSKAIERIEILKGPDGSLFGANSGGVVLMGLAGQRKDSSGVSGGLSGGSYGLFHENVSLVKSSKRSQLAINQGYQRSDGYRQNSAMHRSYVQASERWQYGKSNSLKLLALYSDLDYRTPGGLTQAQYEADPRQSRPAGGPNPAAATQKAGIYNKTFFGGLSNEWFITDQLRYVISVFGTNTDYKNPFITNYEVRNEKNIGTRTYLEWSGDSEKIDWTWTAGLEAQRGVQHIDNFQNNGGVPGGVIASDVLHIGQYVYFTRLSANISKHLTAEAAVSLNNYRYSFSGMTGNGKQNFDPAWMPRFGMSYRVTPDIALRASISRGYSPPTIAEVRPSSTGINTDLQPEAGWNHEAGFRVDIFHHRLQVDASVFRYDLKQAIVRRVDAGGSDYFVNAGGTKQNGVETLITAWLIAPKPSGIIRGVQLQTSYTYSHYRVTGYQNASNDYSGNALTGVPKSMVVLGLNVKGPSGISLFIQSNSVSRIPLTDANDAYASGYNLVQTKLSWDKLRLGKASMELYVGADNLLNEKYSLGNDINAFGSRFYNAAAPRNYYGGINFRL